jgi:hypothetical protein
MNKIKLSICVLCVLRASVLNPSFAKAETAPNFEKRWLSGQFFGEGANFGDFNHDGKMDVVSGPYIWDGPDFTLKHEYMAPAPSDPLGYSRNFFAYAVDVNHDGWNDIIIIGFPGEEAFWYENPKDSKNNRWTQHLMWKNVDNESPTVTNLVGDDAPELVCCSGGSIGYATPDSSDPNKPWTFHPISPKSGYQRFTHGLGVGDVNGDGRLDVIEKSGWFEQPEKLDGDPQWKKHAFDFSQPGSSQMYAYDVDGDGDNDVITALAAHGYGLAWYENVKDDSGAKGGEITFKQHLILSPKVDEKMNDVQFSQLHAVDLVDMDGDGIKDIVTGKRYWAHGPHGDPDPEGTPYLYWFKLTRDGDGKTSGGAHYEPHQIDDHSGVGTQIIAKDANGDGKPDVIVGNKRGTILFLSK